MSLDPKAAREKAVGDGGKAKTLNSNPETSHKINTTPYARMEYLQLAKGISQQISYGFLFVCFCLVFGHNKWWNNASR